MWIKLDRLRGRCQCIKGWKGQWVLGMNRKGSGVMLICLNNRFIFGEKCRINILFNTAVGQVIRYLIWLVVWTPLKNISQLGWLFPIYGKIKNVPNHQPVMYHHVSVYVSPRIGCYSKSTKTAQGLLRLEKCYFSLSGPEVVCRSKHDLGVFWIQIAIHRFRIHSFFIFFFGIFFLTYVLPYQ